MIRKPLLLALLAALLAAGVATAQDAPKGPKLYRWVDKEGKIHYDQALPPEAVNEARREFNPKTGAAIGSVDRALTPEERAQQAQAEQAAIAAAAAANEQKRQEEIMMASYETEAELRRAYGERIDLARDDHRVNRHQHQEPARKPGDDARPGFGDGTGQPSRAG